MLESEFIHFSVINFFLIFQKHRVGWVVEFSTEPVKACGKSSLTGQSADATFVLEAEVKLHERGVLLSCCLGICGGRIAKGFH